MGFVLYRSSAGSGKTYTLVKEYLKIILEHPEKFKHILAITFTNKAAGEMKERIMQSLKNLAKGEDKKLEETLKQEMPQLKRIDKISSEILTTLLHNYSDFAIMTIDSFIHKVIKAFALEMGLPLNFSIDLNNEKIETYVIEKLLAGVGEDEYITDIILKFVFSRVQEEKSWNIEDDIKKFEKELFNEKNIDWIHAVSHFDNIEYYRLMEQLQTLCENYVKEFNNLGEQALSLIQEAGLTIEHFAYRKSGAAGFLQKCANLRRGGEKKFYVGSRFREGQWTSKSAPADIKSAVENLLESGLSQISEAIIIHYDTNRSQALTAAHILDNIYLTAIIYRLKLLIDEYKRKNSVVPISEFNVRVYEIVKNSPVPFIYSIIGEKYSHYLIDEFQDTSRLQWENLFPLIDNTLATGLFNMAVGDGKQSIYRWRGGDWEIMEKDIEERILPAQLSIKPLENNFRSRENIVVFNNRFFAQISEWYKKENVQLEQIYSDVKQHPVRKQGGLVTIQFIEEPVPDVKPERPVFERVKEIINECLEEGYEYHDIAILVRENKNGQMVAENLLENEIPVVSPESLILARVPFIRFLIDILTYLSNPADKIAEASIIYFLTLNRLKKPWKPTALGDYFQKGIQKEISPEISEFFRRRDYLIRMPVYEVIEEIIRIFNLTETLDFKIMGYLQAFLDIVSNYTSDNSVDYSSFLEWWEVSKEEFSVIVPETKPAVKIMTIHKAKGLEFPVVIIPFANWEHIKDKKLWLTSDPPLPTQPPLVIPMPVNTSKLLEETAFQKGFKKEKEKVLIDNINLLYVAFTRAKETLHIIAQRKKNNENYKLLNELAVPMMEKWSGEEKRFIFGQPVSKVKEDEKPSEVEYDETDRLLSNKWYTKISIRRKSSEFWRFDTDYRAERRNWGLLVHQVLSNIRSVEDIPHTVDKILISGDIEREERDILKQKILEIFEIEEVKEWFKPEYMEREQVFTESPILTPEGVLKPDRVIVLADRVIIIDFKTGEKNRLHEDQMVMYKNTIRAMGYQHIEAYLFYLENKEIKPVER